MNFKPPIKNLWQHLESIANKNPEKIALIECESDGTIKKEITYKEFCEKISKTAKWLSEQGIKKEDKISLGLSNSAELLIVSYAAWCSGIITVPLDTKRDTTEDHLYKIKETKSKTIISNTPTKDFESIKPKESKENFTNWEQNLDYDSLILFTSGTTGHPKGALLTLQNLIANADGIKEWFKIEEKDRFLVLLPLHHINSTTFCLATILAGGSIAIPPSYSASNFWNQAAKTKSTFSSIVHSIAFDQLSFEKEFKKVKDDLILDRIQIGSAPVVPSDVVKFVEKYSIKLYQGYGQTETALRVTGVPLDLDEKEYQKIVEKNSIGKPMKWCEVEILDKDGKPAKEGEIAIRGPVVMKNYIGGEEAFKNGWFMSGDLGYREGDYFYIKGRIKEIIIKAGVNISPVAVEEKIKKIDENIDQVYVVGIDDKRLGEEVGAVIVWKENMQAKLALKLLFKNKFITAFETPRYITSIKAEDLPLTSTRKVQRTELRKIPKDKFLDIRQVAKSDQYEFVIIKSHEKHYFKQALDLYNYCWEHLKIDKDTFKQHLDNGIVIAAVNDGKIEGLLSLIITNENENNIIESNFEKITGKNTLNTNNLDGDKLLLVSICSSNYKQSKLQNAKVSLEQVEKYIPEDFVFKFHQRPKGGFSKGASLVKILPNTRPDDKMSLGYNMLLKYPQINKKPKITHEKAAMQLIEAAMIFAKQIGINEIYAYSRPAGLASNFSKKN